MSIAANKAAVRRYLEDAAVAALRTIDALGEGADPDLTGISPGFPRMHGLEEVKQITAPFFGVFSELRVDVKEMIGEVTGWPVGGPSA